MNVQTISCIDSAFRAYRCAPASLKPSVAMPVLYFGDLEAYFDSSKRIVTVAVNPSANEFPLHNPFERFSGAARFAGAAPSAPFDYDDYLIALNAYFKAKPLTAWFDRLDPLLEGFDASFGGVYPARKHYVLHTDLMTPVPTRSRYGKLRKHWSTLESFGIPCWRQLMDVLRPDIALVSFGNGHCPKLDGIATMGP